METTQNWVLSQELLIYLKLGSDGFRTHGKEGDISGLWLRTQEVGAQSKWLSCVFTVHTSDGQPKATCGPMTDLI